MKRVITAWVLISVILVMSAADCITVVKTTDKMENMLSEIISLCRNGETEKAARLAGETEQKWSEYEKYLTLMLDDVKLTEIGADIAKIKPMIEENSDELLAEANNVRRRIQIIRSKEIPKWNNIL